MNASTQRNRGSRLRHFITPKKLNVNRCRIGDIEVTVFALARHLVGMEKLRFDMAMGAVYIKPLFAACTDFHIDVGRRVGRQCVLGL